MIEEYRNLAHDMNKLIHIINVDYNKEMVGKDGIEALEKLEKKNREYLKLCKAIKDNPYLYKESDINIVNRDMMVYKNIILNAKKIMIYYYNQKIFELNRRLSMIKITADSNEDFDKTLLDDIKIPAYDERVLSNYQDKVILDFDNLEKISDDMSKVEAKLLIAREFDKLIKMDYIENFVLDRIEDNINNYGIDKNITKVSIENDIFWIAYELDNLKKIDLDDYHPNRISYIEGKLDFLRDKLNKKKLDKTGSNTNQEYVELKNKLDFFYREVLTYHTRIRERFESITDDKIKDIRNKLIFLRGEYSKLPDKIKEDKVLNASLLAAFTKVENEIRDFIEDSKKIFEENEAVTYTTKVVHDESKVENREEETVSSEPEEDTEETLVEDENVVEDDEETETNEEETIDEEYEVVGVRDGTSVYEKFKKQVLLSAALSTVALLIPATSAYILPALIVHNVYLAYEIPIMNKINNILGKSIGAKKGKDGNWYNSYNQPITRMSGLSGLLKSLVIFGVGKSSIVTSIANSIKKLGEYIPKTYNPNDDVAPVVKRELDIEPLYQMYVESKKGFREFCKSQSLSDNAIGELASYIIQNAQEIASGRGK